MASAADLPTAFAKAERAAGRPLPASGTAFLSVNDSDKPSVVSIAAALAGLGFELVATTAQRATLGAAGLEVAEVAKVADADNDEQTVVDLIRDGRCDLIINTPQGSGARADGYRIREAASPRACRASPRSRGRRPRSTRSRTRVPRPPSRCRSGSRSRGVAAPTA